MSTTTADLTPDEVRDAVKNALTCTLVVKHPDGRITRRPYLSLAAAANGADRARHRGADARVVLTRLQPVAIGGAR